MWKLSVYSYSSYPGITLRCISGYDINIILSPKTLFHGCRFTCENCISEGINRHNCKCHIAFIVYVGKDEWRLENGNDYSCIKWSIKFEYLAIKNENGSISSYFEWPFFGILFFKSNRVISEKFEGIHGFEALNFLMNLILRKQIQAKFSGKFVELHKLSYLYPYIKL